MRTVVVEAVIHYLDMTVDLPGVSEPDPTCLAIVCDTFDSLLGQNPDLGWDDVTYILKTTGRAPRDKAERAALGGLADRLPVLI